MVNVDIDKAVYSRVKEHINKNKVKYPSVKHFINNKILEVLEEKK